MPHSGGGGSHSGGRSHRSHRSGGRHSSSNRPTRGQSTRYPGSKRYVYYIGGKPNYYYSDSALNRGDLRTGYGVMAMYFIVMFLIFMFSGWDRYSFSTGPIKSYGNPEIIDEAGMMTDSEENELMDKLYEFQSKTGVIFTVTTYPEHKIGDTMEVESYNEYCSRYSDEDHWLVYYVGNDVGREDDWEWHLMCGDNCTSVLSFGQEDHFGDVFHANLLKTDMTFSDAVEGAIDSLKPNVSKGVVYKYGDRAGERVSIFALIIPNPIQILFIVFTILSLRAWKKPLTEKEKAKIRAYEVDESNGQDSLQYVSCDYCANQFIKGTTTKCPYCGATIIQN